MAERIVPGTIEWDLYQFEHKQRYEFFEKYYIDKNVLDAACGIGYGTQIISQLKAKNVLGVDISEEALALAQQNYLAPNCRFQLQDCEQLPQLQQKFDVVVSFETVEHIAHPVKLIAGVHEVLVSNGVFICSTPNIYRHSLASEQERFDNPYHVSEMQYDEFKALFQQFFFIEIELYQNETAEYIRYLNLLKEFEKLGDMLNYSWAFRAENKLKKFFGKKKNAFFKKPLLYRGISKDYEISVLQKAAQWQKTFILVGVKK